MEIVIRGLIGVSVLAFVLAVAASVMFSGNILGIVPEAFSRASNNLALLAIASSVALRQDSRIG
jgi:hypothetical protein